MTKQATQTKLKPLGDRVLAKRLEAEDKVKGGIILQTQRKRNKRQHRLSPSAQAREAKAES